MEFKLAKTKILLFSVICFLILILGLYTIRFPEKMSIFFNSPILALIIGLLTSLISLISLGILFRVYTHKSGVIINHDGIIDTSSLVSVGLIKWEDIVRIRKIEVNSVPFLIIDVKNQEEYLKDLNKLKAWWMRVNAKSFGSAISISPVFLKCKFSELEDAVNVGHNRYLIQ